MKKVRFYGGLIIFVVGMMLLFLLGPMSFGTSVPEASAMGKRPDFIMPIDSVEMLVSISYDTGELLADLLRSEGYTVTDDSLVMKSPRPGTRNGLIVVTKYYRFPEGTTFAQVAECMEAIGYRPLYLEEACHVTEPLVQRNLAAGDYTIMALKSSVRDAYGTCQYGALFHHKSGEKRVNFLDEFHVKGVCFFGAIDQSLEFNLL